MLGVKGVLEQNQFILTKSCIYIAKLKHHLDFNAFHHNKLIIITLPIMGC